MSNKPSIWQNNKAKSAMTFQVSNRTQLDAEEREQFFSNFQKLNLILKITNRFLNVVKQEKYQKILLDIYQNLINVIIKKKFYLLF